MSLTSALNSAFSGLTANARASSLLSSNIANALTEGYGRREIALGANPDTGGVLVAGVIRHTDLAVLASRRGAEAEYRAAEAIAAFHQSYEAVIGEPSDANALSAYVSRFEQSLIEAASRPDSRARLDVVAQRGRELAGKLNTSSANIEMLRSNADRSIDTQVQRLNSNLDGIQELNTRIASVSAIGRDTAALQDERQRLIDAVNEMVPLRQVERDHGTVALYTTSGAILLDGRAAEIEFTPSNIVTADMLAETGRLSGLTVNGVAIPTASESSPLRGGTLIAQFHIRDQAGVEAQSDLDALARDLVERFQAADIDPTRSAADPGLFTDAGARFDASAETGLAGRITLNALVDPDKGGESWRLRDGLGATTPGALGKASLLQSLQLALDAPRLPQSGGFGPGNRGFSDLASALLSKVGMERAASEEVLSFTSSSYTQMRDIELADGVDTDVEMQNLLIIEQAYAANARMIEAVDEMMTTLLRL